MRVWKEGAQQPAMISGGGGSALNGPRPYHTIQLAWGMVDTVTSDWG